MAQFNLRHFTRSLGLDTFGEYTMLMYCVLSLDRFSRTSLMFDGFWLAMA